MVGRFRRLPVLVDQTHLAPPPPALAVLVVLAPAVPVVLVAPAHVRVVPVARPERLAHPGRVLPTAPVVPVAVPSLVSRFPVLVSRVRVLAAVPVVVVAVLVVAVPVGEMPVRRSVNRDPSVGRHLRSSNQRG